MTEFRDDLNAMEDRLNDRLNRIEKKVTETNGRVTDLERKDIRRDATAEAEEKARKQATDLVAQKAAEVLAAKERSHRWYLGWGAVLGTSIGGITTAATLMAHVIIKYL